MTILNADVFIHTDKQSASAADIAQQYMFDSMPRDGDGLGQEQQEEQFQLAMTDLVDLR